MAFKKFGQVPYPPLRVIDRNAAIDPPWLSDLLEQAGSKTSMLLRREGGAAKRGGFFFHLASVDAGVEFRDFGGEHIITLPTTEAVRLINHACGRIFDEEMLTLCQRAVNLRQDS